MANTLLRGVPAWGDVRWQGWVNTITNWWHAVWERASDPLDLHTAADMAHPLTQRQLAPTIASEPEFARFFAEFEQPLYGYVRRMVAGDEAAIDITQETFFRAWEHFAALQTYERPQAWLYRVATHLSLNLQRDRSIPFSHLFSRRQMDDAEPSSAIEFADPLDLEAQTVARDVIVRALAVLPERDRATLLLRAVHDLTFAEIGTALDLSEVAVRKALSRARARFRVALRTMETDE